MRIDLLITELNVGGAERQLTQLAIGLSAAGDSVRVITLDELPSTSPQNQLVQALRDAGVSVISIGCRSKWSLPLAIRRLTKLMRDDRPDVVQTFLFHANIVGTIAARRAQVDVRVGGVRVAEPNRVRLAIERHVARHMTAIACVSKSVEAFVREHLGRDELVLTIPNAVDVSRFQDTTPVDWTSYGIAAGHRVMLFVGRLHHQKGLDWLMECAPKMLDENPDSAIVLLGDGPWRSMLEDRLAQMPAGRTAIISWQPDVAPFLAAATLSILPSRFEGMPNAVLEAMAAGLPCLATDVEGVREVLTENTEEQVCPFGDTEVWLERLRTLMADEQLREHISEANRRIVVDKFAIRTMTDAYRQLYQRLVDR